MVVKTVIPVLPSKDTVKDVMWYKKFVGLDCNYSDNMYALLSGNNLKIHLQWHADTDDDP